MARGPLSKSRYLRFLFTFLALERSQCCLSSSPPPTLKHVQILFRHGDRSPTSAWGATDPNPESSWLGGYGSLTDLGREQMYRLGELSRQSYAEFLGDDLSYDDVLIRSSGRDRAFASSRCFLAGLLLTAASAEDRKRCQLDGESSSKFPVETAPVDDDWILRGTKACPRTTQYYLDAYYRASPDIARYIEENKDLIHSVTKATGLYVESDEIWNLQRMWKVAGAVHIARLHGKPLPDWATDEIVDRLHRLRAKRFKAQAVSSPQLVRIAGGALLGHVLSNFNQSKYFNGKEEKAAAGKRELKVVAFSGHDVNLVGLLAALDMFDTPFWPSYTASMYLELHSIRDFHFVKLFFRESVDQDLRELHVPGCESPCPLDLLIRTHNSTAVWTRKEFRSLCVEDDWKKASRENFSSPSVILVTFAIMLGSCVVVAASAQQKVVDGFYEVFSNLFQFY